ncbi:hypothetical protein HDV00_008644 [Rhizophlyctis rosea]|nr:hypothetical protein HDV00_008644 [Rhizophlyctis rosea]
MSTSTPPRLLPQGKFHNPAVISILPTLDPASLTKQQVLDLFEWFIDPNYPASNCDAVRRYLITVVPQTAFIQAIDEHLSQPADYFTHAMALYIVNERVDKAMIIGGLEGRLKEIADLDLEEAARVGDLPYGDAHFLAMEFLYEVADTKRGLEVVDNLLCKLRPPLPWANFMQDNYSEELASSDEDAAGAWNRWRRKVASALAMRWFARVVGERLPLEIMSGIAKWACRETGWDEVMWERFLVHQKSAPKEGLDQWIEFVERIGCRL